MMNNSHLIINARHHLTWYIRLSSDTVTAMMWVGWLYLWRPLAHAIVVLKTVGCTSFKDGAAKVFSCTSGAINFQHAVVALLSTAALLVLWSLLPSRKVKTAHRVNSLGDYARHFDLHEKDIMSGRDQQINVVHHDDHGRIIGIEAR